MFHGASSLKCKDNFRDSSRDDPLDLEQLCSSKMCPGGMAAAWNCSCECRLPSDLCSVALELLHGQGLEDCARASFSLVLRTKSSVVSRFSYHRVVATFSSSGDSQKCVEKGSSMHFLQPHFSPRHPLFDALKIAQCPAVCKRACLIKRKLCISRIF